jgi:hypothetical protein
MSNVHLKAFLISFCLLLLLCCGRQIHISTSQTNDSRSDICLNEGMPLQCGSLSETRIEVPIRPSAFVEDSNGALTITSPDKDGRTSFYGRYQFRSSARHKSCIIVAQSLLALYRGEPREETAPFHVEVSSSYYIIALKHILC